MTNNLHFRCLIEDKKSPSGFKIESELSFVDSVWETDYMYISPQRPAYTHIERGIEIDGTVFYKGDRVKDHVSNPGTVEIHRDGVFGVEFDAHGFYDISLAGLLKVIGTIHDQKQGIKA